MYFDEIFGYLPPIGNPPSKQPMLRMLKQARAFGVGLVLVTQNPVDLDYKGLSNAGTWFIGKLQTEQDKQRLLDGLEGALAGAMDREAYDRLISGLGKRVFLLHNVHNKEPLLVPDPLGDELPGRPAHPHPDPGAEHAGRRRVRSQSDPAGGCTRRSLCNQYRGGRLKPPWQALRQPPRHAAPARPRVHPSRAASPNISCPIT